MMTEPTPPVIDFEKDGRVVTASISTFPKHTAMVARELVAAADQLTLRDGVQFERRSYFGLFDTPGAIDGMAAFSQGRR